MAFSSPTSSSSLLIFKCIDLNVRTNVNREIVFDFHFKNNDHH